MIKVIVFFFRKSILIYNSIIFILFGLYYKYFFIVYFYVFYLSVFLLFIYLYYYEIYVYIRLFNIENYLIRKYSRDNLFVL